MDFNFYMPARVLSGKGILTDRADALKALGERCLVVTGARSAKVSGAYDDLMEAFRTQQIDHRLFDGVGANPLASACKEAGALARESGAQFIVGVGGGSPLDAAKAVAVFAANPELSLDGLLQKAWTAPPLPIVLIGTTAGTGSEVSATSVLTWQDGRKRSITDAAIYASLVYADPRYTYSAGREIRVTTALDAFSHAAEGFFSPSCTEIPARCARVALPLLWRGLKALEAGGPLPEEQLDELYYASLWAGLVLNACGTAFPHPFGYILTEDFSIPHGQACTTFLPALLLRAEQTAPEKARALSSLLSCSMEELTGLLTRMSGTEHIRMTQGQIDAYAKRWVNLKNFRNVPGGYTVEQGVKLFEELFLGPI